MLTRNLLSCLLCIYIVFFAVSLSLAESSDFLSRDVLLSERQELQVKVNSLGGSTVFPEVLPELLPGNIPAPDLPIDYFRASARLLLLDYLLSDIDQGTYNAGLDSLAEDYDSELARVAAWLDQQLKNHFTIDLERLDFIYKTYFTSDRNWLAGADLFSSIRRQHAEIISRQQQNIIEIIDQVEPVFPVAAEYGWQNAADNFLKQFQQEISAPDYLAPDIRTAIIRSTTFNTNVFFQKAFCLAQKAVVDPKAALAARLAHEFRAILSLPLNSEPSDVLALYHGIEAQGNSSAVDCVSVQMKDYDFTVAESLMAGSQYADGLTVLQLLLLYRDVFVLLHDSNVQSFFGISDTENYIRAGKAALNREYGALLKAVNDTLFMNATMLLKLPDESVAPFVKSAVRFDILPYINDGQKSANQEGH